MKKNMMHKSQEKTFFKSHKKPIILIAIILGFFIMIMVFVFDPLIPGQVLHGRFIGTRQSNEQVPFATYFLIALDSGQQIEMKSYMMRTLKKGDRVTVQEETSYLFKRKIYKYIK